MIQNPNAIPPDMVLEIRRLIHSKGFEYLKQYAEAMANQMESPQPWTAEGKEKLFQAALFRKTIRGLWVAVEEVAKIETGKDSTERLLNEKLATEEVIEEVK
jgi:PP-loop superfamily ATP-utilizing enzyme